MTYSSAYFKSAEDDLQDAQQQKYKQLCSSMKLKDGDSVLEIGCGWGSMAIYMVKNYNVKVTAITISKEQYHYCLNRIEKENLQDKIEFCFLDYRNVTGKYDKIVSIEMLEAVGHSYYKSFFTKINEVLKKDGILAMQIIIAPDSRYKEMKKSVDWIQKHIFPGSLLPSIGILNKSINSTSDLTLVKLKEMGIHYSKTLYLWGENFNQHKEKLTKLGFDDHFFRKWNYYLCYCEAAFKMRNINVVQLVYSRPNNLIL